MYWHQPAHLSFQLIIKSSAIHRNVKRSVEGLNGGHSQKPERKLLLAVLDGHRELFFSSWTMGHEEHTLRHLKEVILGEANTEPYFLRSWKLARCVSLGKTPHSLWRDRWKLSGFVRPGLFLVVRHLS
jgi:hypothetical protein